MKNPNKPKKDINVIQLITDVCDFMTLIDDYVTTNKISELEINLIGKQNQKKFLSNLGKHKILKKKDCLVTNKESCSICLDKFKNKESVRKLPDCIHIFHKKCIDKWFKKNVDKECPLCKTSYLKYCS